MSIKTDNTSGAKGLAMTLIFLTMTCLTGELSAEEQSNYCYDKSANQEWLLLWENNPHDDGIVALFSLRMGLCELVKRKVITLGRATKIFEKSRAIEVREKREKEKCEGCSSDGLY